MYLLMQEAEAYAKWCRRSELKMKIHGQVPQQRISISERDVELAYELMLGRAPENKGVVQEFAKSAMNLRELRQIFIASAEFREKIHRDLNVVVTTHVPLDWPKMDIEVDTPLEVLAAMITHVERNWALLGESEPHWSVLTENKFRASEIGNSLDEFYASGQRTTSFFTAAADRAGQSYKGLRRCFELGCGVGRMSIWLAQLFPEVIAADISAPHIRLADEAIKRAGRNNVELRLINTINTIEALPAFDCFVSVIVLQHNPPPVIAFLLRTILKKLEMGGLAYFQVPTYQKDVVFRAQQYLANASVSGVMEVHALPQAVLWQILDETGCRVLDVREDGWVGSEKFISNSVLLIKR